MQEHQWLNKQRDLLKGGQSSIFALETLQRNILKNNLFGVDLNEESVEITKLSLWLKTANKQKPLTNLDDNIKCGNSLIDDPEVAGKKAFDWDKEFADIMDDGGFDVVIGNPPYVEHKKLKGISSKLKYYETYSGTADIYVYFFERGLKLLKENGSLGFITSNKFIKTSYGKNLREFLTKHKINEIIDFSSVLVFEALVASCIISISKKDKKNNKIKIAFINDFFSNINECIKNSMFRLPQNKLDKNIWQLREESKIKLKEKIEGSSVELRKLANIFRGVTTGYNPAFIIDEEIRFGLIEMDSNSKEIIKPLLQGRNIRKWIYHNTKNYIIFTRRGIEINNYPAIKSYLKKFEEELEPGAGRKPGSYKWYEIQDETAYHQNFEKEKIIWGLTANKWAFAFDDQKHYLPSNGYILTSNHVPLKYLIAIMNSKIMKFYFDFIGIMTAGGAFTLKHETIAAFPIKFGKNEVKKNIISSVEKIIEMKNSLTKQYKIKFYDILLKYTSFEGKNISLDEIIYESEFVNKLYSGRARKVRNFTVNINTNIVTLYSDKSGSGKYELLKFQENDKYKRQYLKYYLENLTEEQLDEINENHSGNLLKRVLQIEIPDYDKDQVVRKVVKEWESLQQEIKDLAEEIEKTDNEIDQMVYKLYDLTEKEIEIVEESIIN
ncbi:MAG: Eco57I restriction-modification methylase domain-containing protein [Halanaerobiales bacterium]|nr:Eco57I restriction-modification methylase domain-containing protein [Halanaerobiales bacterium]